MAILQIAKMGHPVLRRVAARVEDPTDAEIARLAADMRETLEDIGASGVAAPQVFVEKRVVVYRMIAARIPEGSDLKPVPWTVMVNPEITPLSEVKVPVWERCLSIPGLQPVATSRAFRTLCDRTLRSASSQPGLRSPI